MNFRSFFKLVEIRTKAASAVPFFIGTGYALYRFRSFNGRNFFLMAASLLCIDMATTAINNLQDFRRADKRHGYGFENHNAIVKDNLKESSVLVMIAALLTGAAVFGLMLFWRTDVIVLLLGGLSFAVGILYSSGPLPISRTPFGELVSGGIMGFVIPFLALYIHVFDKNIVTLVLQGGILQLSINWREILFILLLSFPAVAGIANIMLANNLCDVEDDMANKRFTLPIALGQKRSLVIFKWLYYLAYIDLVLCILLRVAPPLSALVLGTFPIVQKNSLRLAKKQSKAETFGTAVQNFLVINAALAITIGLSAALNYLT